MFHLKDTKHSTRAGAHKYELLFEDLNNSGDEMLVTVYNGRLTLTTLFDRRRKFIVMDIEAVSTDAEWVEILD